MTNLTVVLVHSWLSISSAGFVSTMEGTNYLKPSGDLENQLSISYSIKVSRAHELGYTEGCLTKEESNELFLRALDQEVNWLNNHVDSSWTNNPLVATALISMSYNSHKLIGPHVKQYIKEGDYEELSLEMAYGWDIYKPKPSVRMGLIRRRFAEANYIRRRFGLKELPVPKSVAEFNTSKKIHKR